MRLSPSFFYLNSSFFMYLDFLAQKLTALTVVWLEPSLNNAMNFIVYCCLYVNCFKMESLIWKLILVLSVSKE